MQYILKIMHCSSSFWGPVYDAFSASSRAYRLGTYTDLDARELSNKSKGRDKKLLKDITQRLVSFAELWKSK